MATVAEQIQKVYIGLLGRAADQAGLDYWVSEIDSGALTLEQLRANLVNEQPEYLTGLGQLTRAQAVNQLYQNLFNRDAEAEGLDYWVNGGGSTVNVDQLVLALIEGAQAADTLALDNKAVIANYYTTQAGDEDFNLADARAAIAGVDGSTELSDARDNVDGLVANVGGSFTLTQGTDNLAGTANDDTFVAPLAQNSQGGVTNTLASGDIINGGEGLDELRAQLISENTQVGGQSTAIAPVTTGVENFFFQAQGEGVPLIEALQIEIDQFGDAFFEEEIFDDEIIDIDIRNGSYFGYGEDDGDVNADVNANATITGNQFGVFNVIDFAGLASALGIGSPIVVDAGDMQGVQQLWSFESRTDLIIEDVRSNPNATTIGMDGTDHNVSFIVKYDADVIAGDFGDSAATYEFSNLLNPAEELSIGAAFDGGWVSQISIVIDGELVILNGGSVADATTYAELAVAVQDSLEAQGYGEIQVALDETFTAPASVGGHPGAQLVLVDPEGRTLSEPQIAVSDFAPLGALYFNTDVGAPTEQDVSTNVLLDNVGRNDVGGVLDIGGMSNKGVEVFNVQVDEKSWLAQLQSTSVSVDPDTNSFHHLEVVNISHVAGGAMGDLAIGSQDSCTTDVDPTTMPIGGRVQTNGLRDVRVFNAEGFSGAINLGASFTQEIFGRYLDDAEEPVEFVYTGGEGGNLFTLDIDDLVASDPFFNLTITGGASDDRFNLVGDDNFNVSGISVDGEGGFNTLEVQTDIGVDADSTFAGFENIDELILSGTNDTAVDMATVAGVSELVIATGEPGDGGYNTEILNLAADTTLVISGMNQTVCDTNSNNDQFFGDILLTDAQATSQLIELDNTARVDGELSVAGLEIDGGNVTELTLNSGGRRDTSNTVNNINAALVTSLLFTGSQDLSAEVDLMGQNGSGTAVAFDVDGSALEGDLDLDIETDLITASNANEAAVTLTGTAGDNDLLTLDGGLNPADITSDTTVTGFETVELDNFEGDLDTINFSGVGLYDVVDLNGATTLTSLKDGTNVDLSDWRADNDEITLEGLGAGTINIQLVNVVNNSGAGGDLDWDNSAPLNVSGFATVNLALDNAEGFDETETVDLVLDNPVLTDMTVDGTGDTVFETDTNAQLVEDVVKNLNITGGNADDDDGLILGEDLPASISVIDVSGFAGSFTATLANTVVEDGADLVSANTDTRFVLGAEDADITLTDLVGQGGTAGDGVDFNTIFEFTAAPATQDGGAPAATWTIDNFVAEAFAGSGNDNYSILDLSDLGIGSFAQLDFNDVGTDVVITEEGGASTWEIVLTGVLEADLAPSENFIFA